MTNVKIFGLQHGTVSMGAIMRKYILYIDMDLNLPEFQSLTQYSSNKYTLTPLVGCLGQWN